ncbi:MAG: hypothetical protein Q8N99_03430 [Nanoarchaeota archaeon]|nr:hypothetical protein [Nanoarchaeota archaeon]
MAKAVLEAEVEGLGRILRVDAPFEEALEQLKLSEVKYPITTRDLAYSRMQKGKRSSLSSNGSYTREGFLYVKDNPVLVSLASPLLDLRLARKATQTNRTGYYFSIQDTQIYDRAMVQAEKDKSEEPEKRKVLILPSREDFAISRTKNFELLQGLLKDQTEKYLNFNEQNILVYSIGKDIVDKQSGTLLTQLWFSSLDYRSELVGYSRNLSDPNRMRGVRVNGAEGTQKSF